LPLKGVPDPSVPLLRRIADSDRLNGSVSGFVNFLMWDIEDNGR
jgi:hypothetical protein